MTLPHVANLELDGISFAYGSRLILDRISLDVRARSLFALLGQSGSGKSTLLSIVAGLLYVLCSPFRFGDNKSSSRVNAVGALFKRGIISLFGLNKLIH